MAERPSGLMSRCGAAFAFNNMIANYVIMFAETRVHRGHREGARYSVGFES